MESRLLVRDCRELLRGFPDGCADAVITDPPYGIGAYKGDSKKVALLFPEVLPEIHRVLRPGGALAFFGRWPTFYRWAIAAEEAGFRQREEVIRNLRSPAAGDLGSLGRIHETLYIGSSSQPKEITFNVDDLRVPYHDRYRDGKGFTRLRGGRKGEKMTRFVPNPLGARPPSIIRSTRVDKPRYHDGQKPLADCEWLVKLLANEGDLVLDPFCGAGTIPLACANLGRSFIGMDIEQHWVDVSEKRLADAARQRNLKLPLEAD